MWCKRHLQPVFRKGRIGGTWHSIEMIRLAQRDAALDGRMIKVYVPHTPTKEEMQDMNDKWNEFLYPDNGADWWKG